MRKLREHVYEGPLGSNHHLAHYKGLQNYIQYTVSAIATSYTVMRGPYIGGKGVNNSS